MDTRDNPRKKKEVKEVSKNPCNPPGFDLVAYYHPDPSDQRRNTFGMKLYDVWSQINAHRQRMDGQRMFLQSLPTYGDVYDITFVLLHINAYCQSGYYIWIPAEIGMTAFNIKDGIVDNFSVLVDPWDIPSGFRWEAREMAEKHCLPDPPFDNRLQNYATLVGRMEAFYKKNAKPQFNGPMKIYVLPDHIRKAEGSLNWLYYQTGQKNPFDVYSVTDAMYHLTLAASKQRAGTENMELSHLQAKLVEKRYQNRLAKSGSETASASGSLPPEVDIYKYKPKSYLAGSGCDDEISLSQLTLSTTKSNYDVWNEMRAGCFIHADQVGEYLSCMDLFYESGLCCPYHWKPVDVDAINRCALHFTNRVAYYMLDVLVLIADIEPIPGKHIPFTNQKSEMEKEIRGTMIKTWAFLIKGPHEFLLEDQDKPANYKQYGQVSKFIPQ